jgi:hypothetical protein
MSKSSCSLLSMRSMKLPRPNEVDAFGVVGVDLELSIMCKSLSFGRLIAGSSLIPAFWLISTRACGPILLHLF